MKSRIGLTTEADVPEAHRGLFRDMNIRRALLNHPELLDQIVHVPEWFRSESIIPLRTRELVLLEIGVIIPCQYEFYHHVHIALESGHVSERDITSVVTRSWRNDPPIADSDRACLAATDELTLNASIPDACWDELSNAFEEKFRLELVLLISYYNQFCRILNALKVPLEASYEKYRDMFPLPVSSA